MSADDAGLELRDAARNEDATEADVSEADLDQEEQEKQPMTGGADRAADAASTGESRGEETPAEKNGAVKLKMPEETEDVKFTGLSKEELLRVAGTPGWVRTRWTLLVVFWLGWLGMLAGAVLIILQAPPCKDLPAISWWNQGPLYRLADVAAFSDTGNLKGVQQKLDYLSQLSVKGLVLGPVHLAPPDDPLGLSFEEVSPDVGTLEQFRELLKGAHKKGLRLVLDLSPNYHGSSGTWFSNSSLTSVAERLKSALVFWLKEGVDGVQLAGVEQVSNEVPSLWADIRAIVQNQTDEGLGKRLLLGVTERSSPGAVSALLASSGVDLLVSRVLLPAGSADAVERTQAIQLLYLAHDQTQLVWSIGGEAWGHMASLGGATLLNLHLLLLMTLPGTPVFNYGDEIGLMDQDTMFPLMIWDSDQKLNETSEKERQQRLSCRHLFKRLSELRGKERSLLFGDFLPLFNSSSALAFLRVWDQSPRFVAAFNWGDEEAKLPLVHPALPKRAKLILTTNNSVQVEDDNVDLGHLRLGPREAALLRFTYTP